MRHSFKRNHLVNLKHGYTGTPEHHAWLGMKRRCYYKKDIGYKRYGGRGISVCERWLLSFENFILDMGDMPTPNHSIERINNDGNYEPSNCKWATRKEQCRNRRSNRLLTLNGVTKCMQDWADEFHIKDGTVYTRLKKGWSVEDALKTPLINGQHYHKYGKVRGFDIAEDRRQDALADGRDMMQEAMKTRNGED